MSSPTRRRLAMGAAGVVGVLVLGACGGGEEDVALAIETAERPNGVVLLHVECATDIEVEVRPDPAGSGLQQVTVWGNPKVGTCDPTNQAALSDMSDDQFVDGATSQVITVSPSNLDQPGA